MLRPSPPSAYRRDIDGLRAIAILSVIGFHAFPAWVGGGFVGVDIFFVISGFLISGILIDQLEAGRFSLIDFYAHRIRRIFPALILVLAAMLGGGMLVLWPDELHHLGRHIAGGAAFVINYVLCTETGYFQDKSALQPALHLWSLAIEEQFYVFWPLLLALSWKAKHRAPWLIAFVIGASFLYSQYLVPRDMTAAFYSPFSRFWELIVGGACAWLQRHPLRAIAADMRPLLATGGLVALAYAVFTYNDSMPFPGVSALAPVLGAAALIAAGDATFWNRRFLANPAMVWIGLISYPLYLWHWPLLSFANILTGGAPSRPLRMGLVALAFVLAALTTYFIERPLRRRELNFQRAALLVGLLGTLFVAGIGIIKSNGLPQRFDAAQAQSLDSGRLIETWQNAARAGICHLQDVMADKPAPDCYEDARPLLALWGDSHAATLYPGLRALQETQGFGIAQLTQAGCPPLFDIPQSLFRKNCQAINERILADLARLQPDTVLLAAAWRHRDYPMTDETLQKDIKATIARAQQAAPKARLIVVGPMPQWTSPLPAIFRREISFHKRMPEAYSGAHLVEGFDRLDELLQKTVEETGAEYMSARDYLCDGDKCLTRLGDDLGSIAYVDEEHLTPDAATWLVTRMLAAEPLFQAKDNDASR